MTTQSSTRVWYGDKARRRCGDCGERIEWDERARLGLVAKGGPTQHDGYTPMYAADGHYGNTPEGLAAQAALNAHAEAFHRGGLVRTDVSGSWKLEIHRYGTSIASSREMLKARRPFYAVVTGTLPNGESVSKVLHGFSTVEAARFAAFPNVVHMEQSGLTTYVA